MNKYMNEQIKDIAFIVDAMAGIVRKVDDVLPDEIVSGIQALIDELKEKVKIANDKSASDHQSKWEMIKECESLQLEESECACQKCDSIEFIKDKVEVIKKLQSENEESKAELQRYKETDKFMQVSYKAEIDELKTRVKELENETKYNISRFKNEFKKRHIIQEQAERRLKSFDEFQSFYTQLTSVCEEIVEYNENKPMTTSERDFHNKLKAELGK